MKYFALKNNQGKIVSILTTGLSASKVKAPDGYSAEEVSEEFVLSLNMNNDKESND